MVRAGLSDGEHRDYYEDRSLKAVYTIKDGKREGTYTEYAQNSDVVRLTEEYSGGELHGERIEYGWNGAPAVTEIYEHGTIIERRWNDEHYEIYQGGELYHLVDKSWRRDIDMYYKDGKEYEGTHSHIDRVGGRDGDNYVVRYTLKEGKYHGEYRDDEQEIFANYDMGVLHGKYREKSKDGSLKEGEYNQGRFSGTVTSGDGLKVENWVDGKLDCTTTYSSVKRDWYGKIESRGSIVSEIRPDGECTEYRNGILLKRYQQKDGVKDGRYEELDPKGWVREISHYKAGELQQKTEYYSDGNVVSANEDKTSDGEHRDYYEDRSLKAVYTVKDGKREGTYTEYAQNSDAVRLTEEYSGGELHGRRIEYDWNGAPTVTETFEHGTIAERRWSDEQSDEHYEIYQGGELYHLVDKSWRRDIDMYYKDGKEYEGTHSHIDRVGGRDGDNYVVRYTLKEGKYHGEYFDEYEGTQINYDMGVLHGKYKARLKDGSLKEGEYEQGQFSGTVTSRDGLKVEKIEKDKCVSATVTSKDGLIVESWIDGKLDCVTTYEAVDWYYGEKKRGNIASEIRPDGECVEYENGVPVKRYQQKGGVRDGRYEELDPKGWVRAEGQYRAGELQGFYKEYNSDGSVASRRFYKDGEDVTPQREILQQAAREHVFSTDEVAPKQSKFKKAKLAVKMAMASLNKGKKDGCR